ncbi:MAG: ComF family protein [Candidatus Aminicenantes bacterium]|nr:ComF family protein [Candidatus Aminicenantes bacterium]
MNFSIRNAFAQKAKLFELAVFPSFCKICRALLESPVEKVLCRTCLDKITPLRASFCPSCGRFFEGAGDPHLCSACLNEAPPFSMHRSCAKYRGGLKDTLLLFKYRRYRVLGQNLAEFIAEALKKEDGLWWGVDVIVPVPLHRRRRWERGFNQAEVLARELGRIRRIPVETRALKKVKNVPPQTSLEREERRSNVRDAYRTDKADRIRDKIVLLVDDVYTTGSTLRECAAVLKKAGVKDVRAVTVAQA